MEWWKVYLWLQMDNIHSGCMFLVAILFVLIMNYTITLIVHNKKESLRSLGWMLSAGSFIFLVILTSLLPGSKQIAAIVMLPKIINSEVTKELTGDAADMYKMMKEYLKELMKGE